MNPIKVKRNPPQRVIHPIPSHNGFGSEEDSLLSVFYLNPAGKVHEYYTDKFKRDKHILRFSAKMNRFKYMKSRTETQEDFRANS